MINSLCIKTDELLPSGLKIYQQDAKKAQTKHAHAGWFKVAFVLNN